MERLAGARMDDVVQLRAISPEVTCRSARPAALRNDRSGAPNMKNLSASGGAERLSPTWSLLRRRRRRSHMNI